MIDTDTYKEIQNFKFNSYNLYHGTRMWYLNGIRTYDNIPTWFTVASSSSREELLVWADINGIKIDYES